MLASASENEAGNHHGGTEKARKARPLNCEAAEGPEQADGEWLSCDGH